MTLSETPRTDPYEPSREQRFEMMKLAVANLPSNLSVHIPGAIRARYAKSLFEDSQSLMWGTYEWRLELQKARCHRDDIQPTSVNVSVVLPSGKPRTFREPTATQTIDKVTELLFELAKEVFDFETTDIAVLLQMITQLREAESGLERCLDEARCELAEVEARFLHPEGMAVKPDAPPQPAKPAGKKPEVKRKTETSNGTGAIILAGLLKHHDYDNGGCLNFEPVVLNEFARQISVSSATVSRYLRKHLKGMNGYKAACASKRISDVVKLLNGDILGTALLGDVADSRLNRNRGTTDSSDD